MQPTSSTNRRQQYLPSTTLVLGYLVQLYRASPTYCTTHCSLFAVRCSEQRTRAPARGKRAPPLGSEPVTVDSQGPSIALPILRASTSVYSSRAAAGASLACILFRAGPPLRHRKKLSRATAERTCKTARIRAPPSTMPRAFSSGGLRRPGASLFNVH